MLRDIANYLLEGESQNSSFFSSAIRKLALMKLWVTNLWNGLHVLTLLPITDIYHARLWVTNQSNGFCVLLETKKCILNNCVVILD